MQRIFAKLPRPMQRTFVDDLRWAAAVLTGATIAYLTIGQRQTGILVGALVGVTLAIAGLNVARRVSSRLKR